MNQTTQASSGPGHRGEVMTAATAVHLHANEPPHTLRLLAALLGRRTDHHHRLGYEPTDTGAYVDWDQLVDAPLSSTQVATVRIARACATIERAGGLPPELGNAVVDAVANVSRVIR